MDQQGHTRRVRGSDITMADGLRTQARLQPDKKAVIFEEKSLTYSELDDRACRLANALMAMGLEKGDRVAIYSTNRIEFAEFYSGLPKAGLVSVPLSYHLKEEELEYGVNHADCKAILVEPLLLGRLEAALDRFEHITREKVVVFGDKVPDGMKRYDELLSGSSNEDPMVSVRADDPFYIGYTSGTTGRPKGAVISHRARVFAVITGIIEYGQTRDEVILCITPLYHAAPMAFLLGSVFLGSQVVIMPHFDPEGVLKLIEKHRVTSFFAVPTIFNFILMLPEEKLKSYDLSSMRGVVSAAAPLHIGTKQRIMEFLGSGIELHEFYGGSETAMAVNLPACDTIRKNGSVGKAVAGVDVKILDENRKPLPAGEVGEIFMRTPCLMTEYEKEPQRTEEAFWGDYMTIGDVGYLDEEGFLYLVDRRADMVISGGVNIYPKEIEDVLTQHDGIMEAVVIGVPDEVWGESLKAFVVPVSGADLTETEIMDYVKSRLAGFKVPKSVEFTRSEDLPRSAVGKILKREIRERYWKGRDRNI